MDLIDGNWVDICTFVTAIIYGCISHRRSAIPGKKFLSRATALHVLNGASIFPFILLALAAVSSSSLNALMASNKIILSFAGIVALMALLEKD